MELVQQEVMLLKTQGRSDLGEMRSWDWNPILKSY